MNPLDDGSNSSIAVSLLLAAITGIALFTARAMRRLDRIVADAWATDIDALDTGDLSCPCDRCNAWYEHRSNTPAGRPWWKPGGTS